MNENTTTINSTTVNSTTVNATDPNTAPTDIAALGKDLSLHALKLMLNSRIFEEKTEQLFKAGLVHGTTHLANGQEAAQAGLCLALEPEDWIVPTHRCHGFSICKGSNPAAMFAELFGSRHGLAKGLGGSMHMPDKEKCNLGSSAVVGSGVPLATGIAFYQKFISVGSASFATSTTQNPKDLPPIPVKNISVAIFGDGASSRGSVHESMNIASIWKLPVLFYCENNLYGMSAPSDKMISIDQIAQRGASYNIPSKTVDGNDFQAVYQAVLEATSYIRSGNGPYLLEVMTYRFKGHSRSDRKLYRTAEEEKMWLEKDPITLFENKIIQGGYATTEEIEKIHQECQSFIEEQADLALKQASDKLSVSEVENLVYAPQEARQ